MAGRNRFGFAPPVEPGFAADDTSRAPAPEIGRNIRQQAGPPQSPDPDPHADLHADLHPGRETGPMGAAVREAAAALQAAAAAQAEQRRANAALARDHRLAQAEGRLLVALPLDAIGTDDLPRDRIDLAAVAASDAMAELKASIRARGQKEPVEVYAGPLPDADRRPVGGPVDGVQPDAVPTARQYQLKKGWRRLTALRQLYAETGDPRFSRVIARVAPASDRIALYIDMVEENVIRQDLSFAEMAQVARDAAADPACAEAGAGAGAANAEAMVGQLYASLHRMKRSYIRSFVVLLDTLGADLHWPTSVPRNLGVAVARRLKADPGGTAALRSALHRSAGPDEQNAALERHAAGPGDRAAAPGGYGSADGGDGGGEPGRNPGGATDAPLRVRTDAVFQVGTARVTARPGECRIAADTDYAGLDRALLARAVAAFAAVLAEG